MSDKKYNTIVKIINVAYVYLLACIAITGVAIFAVMQ